MQHNGSLVNGSIITPVDHYVRLLQGPSCKDRVALCSQVFHLRLSRYRCAARTQTPRGSWRPGRHARFARFPPPAWRCERTFASCFSTSCCGNTYPNSDARTLELTFRIQHYNFFHPHSATAGKPPATRLGSGGNNMVRDHTQGSCDQIHCTQIKGLSTGMVVTQGTSKAQIVRLKRF